MRSNALLLEQITLAEEILEKGPGDGRGYRLAGVVLAMHEELGHGGHFPDAWRPHVPSILPPPLPGVPDNWPDLDELDAAWETVLAPPPVPSFEDDVEMELDEFDFEEEILVVEKRKSTRPLILVY